MKIVLFAIIISFSISVASQNTDTEFAIYNVLSGTVIGGIGAVINKNPEENFWKTFFRGSSQGALRGYLNFESKRLVRNFSETGNYSYVWPSRLLNAAGNSIIMNGASNYKFGESWHFNLAFAHLEYNSKKTKKLKLRALPFALAGTVTGFIVGKLDVQTSLKTGTFIFDTERDNNGFYYYSFANTIFYNKAIEFNDKSKIIGHELIHTYQYNGTFPLNSYLNKYNLRFETSHSKIYNFYSKYFYSDLNFLINLSVLGVQEILQIDEFDRLLEIEPLYFGDQYKN